MSDEATAPDETDVVSAGDPTAAITIDGAGAIGPLEYPTGPRGIRPATAWVIGLFALVAVASIIRHALN